VVTQKLYFWLPKLALIQIHHHAMLLQPLYDTAEGLLMLFCCAGHDDIIQI
jgi:hypothetical protein